MDMRSQPRGGAAGQSSRSGAADRRAAIRSEQPARADAAPRPAPRPGPRVRGPRSPRRRPTPAGGRGATSATIRVVALAAGVDDLDGSGHALRHARRARPSSTRTTCAAQTRGADQPGVQPSGGARSVLPPAVGSGADDVRAVDHQHLGTDQVGRLGAVRSAAVPSTSSIGQWTIRRAERRPALSTARRSPRASSTDLATGAYESGRRPQSAGRASATNHRDLAGRGGPGAQSGGRAPAAADSIPTTGQWPLTGAVRVVAGYDPPAQRWGAGHRGVDLAARPGRAGAGRGRPVG